MLKAVIYVRVNDPSNQDGFAGQEAAVRDMLRRHQISNDDVIVIEDTCSGIATDRPGWSRVRQMVSGGDVGVLAAADYTRFSREPTIHMEVEAWRKAGVRVLTCDGGPHDAMLRHMADMIAEEHRRRTRRGMMAAAANGRAVGKPPFGYRVVDGEIRVDPAESSVVQCIFDAYANQGWPISRIVDRLTSRQAKLNGRVVWTRQAVLKILQNEQYRGRWAWGRTVTQRDATGRTRKAEANDEKVIDTHRPGTQIISDDLWHRAQSRLNTSDQAEGEPGQAA